MRSLTKSFLFLLVALVVNSSVLAQHPAAEWDRLFERRQGWLGADGIYTVDLNHDVRSNSAPLDAPPRTLFIFSDTISGNTKENGENYDQIFMTNHSFGLLTSKSPRKDAMTFVWRKQDGKESSDKNPQNIVNGLYWLQDGVRYGNRLWLTAILVGDAWKPKRIDALSFPIDALTCEPDFSTPSLDVEAPLSLRTNNEQIVMGAAICDDADDGFLYVFGYVDRLRNFSRKDAVVARVPRERLEDYDEWRFYNGTEWEKALNTLVNERATIVRNVSTEFSISKIQRGEAAGKWLMVYTPGTISEKVAFRIGATPYGPFGEEHVFWSSTVTQEMKQVRCYNAKAHPTISDDHGVLVSINVNRLGEIAQKPSEYRPRFVWLDWQTVEKAAREDAPSPPSSLDAND